MNKYEKYSTKTDVDSKTIEKIDCDMNDLEKIILSAISPLPESIKRFCKTITFTVSDFK